MKTITPLLFSLLISVNGCNINQSDKQNVIMQGATIEFERIINENQIEGKGITPTTALNSIVEVFNKSNDIIVETKEKTIDLYVIYGSGYWDENGEAETFAITFAHQVVEELNGPLYEYRITLIYDTQPFNGIKEFDMRYPRDVKDVVRFKDAVQQSEGFKKALVSKIKRVEIIKEEI